MQNESDWLPTKEASKALCVSRPQLYRLRADGIIKPGVHFYSKSGKKDFGQVVWNVPAVRQSLLDLTAQTYVLAGHQ